MKKYYIIGVFDEGPTLSALWSKDGWTNSFKNACLFNSIEEASTAVEIITYFEKFSLDTYHIRFTEDENKFRSRIDL